MEITDAEKKKLRTAMLVYGYSEYETDFFNTSTYRDLRTTMLEYLPYSYEKLFEFTLIPKSEVLKSGKYIIDKHFNNFDLLVLYANGDELESEVRAKFGYTPKPEQYDDIINYINDKANYVRVTDVPVYLNICDNKNGYVTTSYLYGNNIVEEDYFKNIPVCLREIAIQGRCDEEARCTYVHEMIHALENRHKGNIRNQLNREALPIFMEKVAANDLDLSGNLLNAKSLIRISQNKEYILKRELLSFKEEGFSDLLMNEGYIISTLHATALFDTYAKASKRVKKEIIDSVGRVLVGESILDDVIEHYEASLEKGTKLMKKQIKDYHQQYFS